MSSAPKLRRFQVGGLPLLRALLQQIGLRELLAAALPAGAGETVSTADTLVLLAINLAVAKDPLYALAEIVHHHQVERFLHVRTIRHAQHWRRRGPGRPGKLPLYRNHFTVSYQLVWPRLREALQRERGSEGPVPL